MMRLRRRQGSEQIEPAERRHPEAPSDAGPDARPPQDVPVSVWLPAAETKSRSEPTGQSGRIPEPVEPAQARWMTIAQGAQTEVQQTDQNAGGEEGDWLPSQLKPEANPLATGAWLGQEEVRHPAPAQIATTAPAAEEPPTAPTSEEPATAPPPDELLAAPSEAGPEPGEVDEQAGYGQRTRAAEAYCRELFPTDDVGRRAKQILGSLSGGIPDDRVLLELLRTSAAELLDGSSVSKAPEEISTCEPVFGRLAGRANGTLGAGERSRLEQHVATCVICKAAELRAARADRAFAAILGLALEG